jgi:branched-chain amino acid transport system ATP-binding protein
MTATTETTSALVANDITVRFGGLVAVKNVSFTIPQGRIVSLIGPNGAGKTTFFNVLTGLYRPSSGNVLLGERDITGQSPHTIASIGLGRTFQNIRLFGLMTAAENVMVAMHSHTTSNLLQIVARTRHQRREEVESRAFAQEMLDFVGIGRHADEYARNLSYGDQRRLEVARALAPGATARRADRGHEPPGVGGLRRLRPARPGRAQGVGPADRARHERGHARVRADHGARPGREDRRGRS